MSWELALLLIVVSVALNGFYAGAETGFTTARRISLIHQARKGRRGAALAARMVRHREQVMISAVVGNNLAVVAGSAVATAAFLQRFGDSGESWAALTMTALNIVFGEVLPKAWFRARPESSCVWAAPLLYASGVVLAPLRWLAVGLAMGILRLFGSRAEGGVEAPLSRERIVRSLRASARVREIDEEENRVLTRTLEASRLRLAERCTPMEEVGALGEDATVQDAIDLVRERGHSRLPLLDGEGRIIGLVLFRDLVRAPSDAPVLDHRRDLLRLHEGMGLEEGVSAFIDTRTNLAAVVDGEGRSRGIVTLEDLLEPLVGPIADEHDR